MEKQYLLMDDEEYTLGIPAIVEPDETSLKFIEEIIEKYHLNEQEQDYSNNLYSKYSSYKEVDNMLHDESLELEIDKYIDAVDDLTEKLAEKDNIIAKKDDMLAEKDDMLAEKDDMLAEKDDMLAEKDNQIAELQKQLMKYMQQ